MKARAISKFIWRDKRYEVNDPVEVDEPKASQMVKEGLIALDAPVESAAPEKSEPDVAAPAEPGDSAPAAAPITEPEKPAPKPHKPVAKSKKKSGGKV